MRAESKPEIGSESKSGRCDIARESWLGEAELGWCKRLGNVPFVMMILLYRITLSPFIGGQCRFEPTCSRYALGAYRRYGPVRGTALTMARIGRCHPFHKGGYDPVPFAQDPATGGDGAALGRVDCFDETKLDVQSDGEE